MARLRTTQPWHLADDAAVAHGPCRPFEKAGAVGYHAGAAMETLDLVILVGIQASGKTTYYRRHLRGEYLHVSLDNWRGKGNVRAKEHGAILEALASAGGSGGRVRGVVVDNTNTTSATRRRYFDYAAEFSRDSGRGVRLVAYFFDADLESCLARNADRPKDAPVGTPYYVPPEALEKFQGMLQPPAHEEGFEKVFRVRIAEDGAFDVTEM